MLFNKTKQRLLQAKRAIWYGMLEFYAQGTKNMHSSVMLVIYSMVNFTTIRV